MKVLLAIFLGVHGLIHLMGFAKAFRYAELPQLTQPIGPLAGGLWVVAAALFLAAAGMLFVSPRWWWVAGTGGVALSFVVTSLSWTDAKFGAAANLLALVAVVIGFSMHGPTSLRAAYEREVDQGLGRLGAARSVTDDDLTRLPAPVRRFLRVSGVVGQPRVQNVRARMHGRFRNGPGARWMPFTAEQYNFYDRRSRLFYMEASMFAIPFQAFHRYAGPSATMKVKVFGLIPVAEMSGPEADEAETVTMFNDMSLIAPATLIDPSIEWEPVDARTVRAAFTNAGHRIRAELSFNDAGELTNFWSDDRGQSSPDGKTMVKKRWSTPFGDYRSFGRVRLSARGEARWHEPSGDYAYIEVELDDVEYNVRTR